MNAGYFVSKNEIVNWFNNILELKTEKIEQLGNGAAYCQVIEHFFPGSVSLQKVQWNARLPYEILANYKILTNSLNNLQIKKVVDVQKLS